MWNFFDRTGDSIEIQFKISENVTWQQWVLEQENGLAGLFFNPNLNLSLAQYNVIEHFIADLQQESPSVEQLTSFKLLQNLLRVDLTERLPDIVKFQFKIIAFKDPKPIELYISPWVQVKKS